MPASGGDPVVGHLRFAFSVTPKMHSNGDLSIKTCAKAALVNRIEHEPPSASHKTIHQSHKSKYSVMNPQKLLNNHRTNGIANGKLNEPQLPAPKTTLFPIDKVQLGYRGSLTVGSGMMNLGNTCYLNSTLQALFHVPAFVNWLLSDNTHLKCEQTSAYQMHADDITCAVIKTLKCSQQNAGSHMRPMCVYSKLKAVSKRLSQGSQEDAHEFMRCLLERLEEGFLAKVQGQKLDNWSKETTPIHQIFGGYIRTEVACLSCHAVSTTFQHFQDLPVDIRKASTLDDALSVYFERERLPEGENAFKCEKCSRKVSATKKYSIERAPNVLCIQLKRFNAMNGKLTKHVQLPQQLDLARFMSPSVHPRCPVRYRLMSMVTHIGQSANMGHYTAIALAANGSYYQFDDSNVRQIPPNTIQNMSAYIVLYELERALQQHNGRAGATAAESTAHKESESASVGGSETKQPMNNGSPTAGSPAPLTSPVPGTSSLVPYDSDADSDTENETAENIPRDRKIATPDSKKRVANSPLRSAAISTSSWRVSTVVSTTRSEVADTPTKENGEARDSSNSRENCEKQSNGNSLREAEKRVDISSAAVQNGRNRFESWSATPRHNGRPAAQDRRGPWKRPYSDDNGDFDHAKKRKRFDYLRNSSPNVRENCEKSSNGYGSREPDVGSAAMQQNIRNRTGSWNGAPRYNSTNIRENCEKQSNGAGSRQAEKRPNIVSALIQNGRNRIGWNGVPRSNEQERKETWKRPYDDEYNTEFDRGKMKRKRHNYGRDMSRGPFNAFQKCANEMNNGRRYNRHFHYKHHQRPYPGYNKDFRRNH